MRSDFPVVLDACVLVPPSLCDLFLRLAETPRMYLPLWSEEILEEVRRTQMKLPWPEGLPDHWQREVRKAFPESIVSGYEEFLSICKNDEKDRHVLAVALKIGAEVIVTFNQRHFPRSVLEPLDVTAVHPASYLITLYGMDSGLVVSKLEAIARNRSIPPEQVLAQLAKMVPAFSRHVAAALGWDIPTI